MINEWTITILGVSGLILCYWYIQRTNKRLEDEI